MPDQAFSGARSPYAVNDDSAEDQKRIVARIATRWFLQGMNEVRALGAGDILDGLIMLAVTDANTRHLNAADSPYHASRDVPPDEDRLPVSVYVIAKELGISYETARRHVQRLIQNGRIERVAEGIIVPGRVFASRDTLVLTERNFANVQSFIRQLRAVGMV